MDNNTEYSILLHVIEGIRLNINNNDLSLIATLNGIKFEIIGHNTETATIFNSNCIWECMSDDLKRMKTDNRPIKIECFHKTIKNNNEIKKAIGFILLPIRTLQVVKTKNLQIKLHWYKLSGLAPEWRNAKPEINLSVIITTKEIIEAEQLENFMDPKTVESSESIFIKSSETSLMLKPQSGIYVNLLEDECCVQIGQKPYDIDTFIFSLNFKNAKHLEELVEGNANPVFRFHYDILGSPSDLNLVANSDGVYSINEKITINFKSSLESLKEYFKRVFYIPIDLYYNDNIIGNYTFKFVDIMPSCLELLESDNVWEVKDSFSLVTLYDILESPVRPLVEYIFCLSYVPAMVGRVNQRQTELIDKKACGDMGDKNDHMELPPTEMYHKAARTECQTRSVTHRINQYIEELQNSSRSDTFVSYKCKPKNVTNEDIAYKVILELEDWKSQQMNEFLVELKRKETIHLNQFSAEWQRQKKAMTKDIKDKLDECNRMTESLETARDLVNSQSLKILEEERELEKAKHELDKRYTVKFMEVEEKERRLSHEMDYQQKLNDLRYRELLNEKNIKVDECDKLREKIKQLEQEIEEIKKKYIPNEQLAGLLDDLRQQSERFSEMEKSKNFYKKQWAIATKEAHKLKLQSLKVQEENLKRSGSLGINNIIDLRNLIFEERSALTADRSELKNIKDVLTSESDIDESKNSYDS